MQKHVDLVDLVKSFPTNIYLQNLASIQKRTSSVKFAHLAEKSGKGSIPNLSTKVFDAATGAELWALPKEKRTGRVQVFDEANDPPNPTGYLSQDAAVRLSWL